MYNVGPSTLPTSNRMQYGMFQLQKLTKQQLIQWLSVQASLLPTQEYSFPKCELHINTDLHHESEYLKSKENYGIDPGVKRSYPCRDLKL